MAVCFTSSSKPTRLTVNAIFILPITILTLRRSLGQRTLGVDLRYVIESTHENRCSVICQKCGRAGETYAKNFKEIYIYLFLFFIFFVKLEKKKPSSQIPSSLSHDLLLRLLTSRLGVMWQASAVCK